uniref:USP8 dimerisation domain-containing protein n=1 Tax=Timema genevievae TaxID=629358 RepID=A0A7R9K2S3_TIMGE|nr:unnamed protein product [Timema genevievae]
MRVGDRTAMLGRFFFNHEATKSNNILIGLCKSAEKLYAQAELFDKSGDEEMCYLALMKYLGLIQVIKDSPEYRNDKKFYVQILGSKKVNSAMDWAEKVSLNLELRHRGPGQFLGWYIKSFNPRTPTGGMIRIRLDTQGAHALLTVQVSTRALKRLTAQTVRPRPTGLEPQEPRPRSPDPKARTLLHCQHHHSLAIKLAAPQSPTCFWAAALSKLATWAFGPVLCDEKLVRAVTKLGNELASVPRQVMHERFDGPDILGYARLKEEEQFEKSQSLRKKEAEEEQKLPKKQLSSKDLIKLDGKLVNGTTSQYHFADIKETSISSHELYSILMDSKKKLLILDTRAKSAFEDSHIKTLTCISVPEEIIKRGLSADKIGHCLAVEDKPLWDKRGEMDLIVLTDWFSTHLNLPPTSPIEVLNEILIKWDPGISYKAKPIVILRGGYEDFVTSYPMLTTNAHTKLPLSNHGQSITDLIDAVNYPSLVDTSVVPQPLVDRSSKPPPPVVPSDSSALRVQLSQTTEGQLSLLSGGDIKPPSSQGSVDIDMAMPFAVGARSGNLSPSLSTESEKSATRKSSLTERPILKSSSTERPSPQGSGDIVGLVLEDLENQKLREDLKALKLREAERDTPVVPTVEAERRIQGKEEERKVVEQQAQALHEKRTKLFFQFFLALFIAGLLQLPDYIGVVEVDPNCVVIVCCYVLLIRAVWG